MEIPEESPTVVVPDSIPLEPMGYEGLLALMALEIDSGGGRATGTFANLSKNGVGRHKMIMLDACESNNNTRRSLWAMGPHAY